MKYKVGDKVRLVNTLAYAGNRGSGLYVFRDWLGKVVTIDTAKDGFYTTKEIKAYFLTEEMIEGLAEDTKKSPVELFAEMFRRGDEAAQKEKEEEKTKQMLENCEHGLLCPDGYEFRDENGNVINATKIVLEKKKPKYPKTIIECCTILKAKCMATREEGYKGELLKQLQLLLVCRDAYWKIVGDEMGLGKPWKPNWDKCGEIKYHILPVLNSIVKHDNHLIDEYENRILVFPTKEMRDAFYENFKELIEECKELL